VASAFLDHEPRGAYLRLGCFAHPLPWLTGRQRISFEETGRIYYFSVGLWTGPTYYRKGTRRCIGSPNAMAQKRRQWTWQYLSIG
jgi:hypothetical protein